MNQRRVTIVGYVILITAPLILFTPVVLTGKALFWGTPALQFVPWRDFAWNILKSGNLPLWNPMLGMGAPLIANYQSAIFYPPNWLLFLFERLTGRYTDAYVSVSRIISETYIQKGIGKKDNHFTVYSGIELTKFYQARDKVNYKEKYEELGIHTGDFIIGNVARLELRKGHKFLLEVFRNIVEKQKDCPAKLLIIGEGNKREGLENYVKELNLEGKVIFAGYREDVEELMAVMDIFVLTSLREGLPRVLVQAAAVGMPSVVFNVDGVSEIIKDNYNGFLVDVKNLEELENRILQYMNNKELVLLHGRNGREFIKNKWSIKGMVDRIDKIYQKLITEKIEK